MNPPLACVAETGLPAQTNLETSSAELCRDSPTALVQTTLRLLLELEASLQASQKALLSGDPAAIEDETRQQMRLQSSLEVTAQRPARPAPLTYGVRSAAPRDDVTANLLLPGGDRLSGDPPLGDPQSRQSLPGDLALAAELRCAQMRVLHLGRIQAALVARALRWTRTLSNLLAGPESSYAPSVYNLGPECGGWPPADSGWEGTKDECRA